jgi:hypothetical protein
MAASTGTEAATQKGTPLMMLTGGAAFDQAEPSVPRPRRGKAGEPGPATAEAAAVREAATASSPVPDRRAGAGHATARGAFSRAGTARVELTS